MSFPIDNNPMKVSDLEIVGLLTRAYVGGGFTTARRAAEIFAPASVRSRGELISVRTSEGLFAGMVIVVGPDAPARRMAGPDEAEIHLLAVDPLYRRAGLGRLLMSTALDSICQAGLRKVVLWTQPSMKAAHRLYESMGFVRAASRDPIFDEIHFLAYEQHVTRQRVSVLESLHPRAFSPSAEKGAE